MALSSSVFLALILTFGCYASISLGWFNISKLSKLLYFKVNYILAKVLKKKLKYLILLLVWNILLQTTGKISNSNKVSRLHTSNNAKGYEINMSNKLS